MDKDTKDWFTNKLKVLPQNTLRQTEMLVEELEDEDIIAKKTSQHGSIPNVL